MNRKLEKIRAARKPAVVVEAPVAAITEKSPKKPRKTRTAKSRDKTEN